YAIEDLGMPSGAADFTASGMARDATRLADGWAHLPNFNWTYYASHPWLYSQTQGWFYVYDVSDESVVYYDMNLDAAVWTNVATFPAIYLLSGHTGWYRYEQGVAPARTFYSWQSNTTLPESALLDG